jgi:hypothetical protein
MFQKCVSSHQVFDTNTAESLADLLYEMGKSHLIKQEYSQAIKWLERSYQVLSSQELDRLSMDASELRTSTIAILVKALLGLETHESLDRARNLVDLLESDFGDKLVVLVLKLDILLSHLNEPFDSNSYGNILDRMTRSAVLSAENFKLLMYHIRRLNEKNQVLACKVLDSMLKLRVLPEGNEELIEKVLITRLYMAGCQENSTEALLSVDAVLSLISAHGRQPLRPATALAAHTVSSTSSFLCHLLLIVQLLWKIIESNYIQKQFDLAERWCCLAMHSMFEKSGEANLARISRRVIKKRSPIQQKLILM